MQHRHNFITHQTQKFMKKSVQFEKNSVGLSKGDLQILRQLFGKVSSNITIRQLAYHIRQHFMSLFESAGNSHPQTVEMSNCNTLTTQVNGHSKITLMDSIQYSQTINLERSIAKTQNMYQPLSQSNAGSDMKNKYLEFFLKCQAKLYDKNSDEEWKVVFDRQMRKHCKLAEISQDMINKIKFRLCWAKLVNIAKPKIKINSIFQQRYNKMENKIQKIETSVSEIADIEIQVEEDIKIKTKYFFKWFKFLQQSKQLQRLRLQQLQNIQMSINFHGYSIKQNRFNHWKETVKYNKQQRAFIRIIKEKWIFKQIFKFIGTLKSTKQLRKIQQGLEKVVQEKILNTKANLFFKFLLNNRQRNRKIALSVKPITNIWYFRSLVSFSEGMCKNQAKTFKTMRQNFEQNYSSKCLWISWSILKNNLKIMKESVKKVHKAIVITSFKRTINRVKKIKNQEKCCLEFINFLTQKKRAKIIYLLELNRIKSKVKLEKLQVLNKSLKHSKINRLLDLKEQNRAVMEAFIQSQKTLESRLSIFSKFRAIKLLSKYCHSVIFQKKKSSQISNFIMFRALSDLKVSFDHKKVLFAKQNNLSKKSRQRLLCQVFRILKTNVQIRASQKKILAKIGVEHLNKWTLIILSCMKQAKLIRNNIQQLIIQLNRQIIKKCFAKMFKPSLKIMTFIKSKASFRQLQMKRSLFQMIRTISMLNHKNIIKISQFVEIKAKRKIFERFMAKKVIQSKQAQTINFIKQIQQKIVFLKLKKNKQSSSIELSNKIKIFGSIFYHKIYNQTKRRSTLKNNIKQAKQKIGNLKKEHSFSFLLGQIWQMNEVKTVQSQKYKVLMNLRIKLWLQRIKKSIVLLNQHSKVTLNKKINATRMVFKKHTFKYLAFPQKIQQVKQLISRNYIKLFFNYIEESHDQSTKIEKIHQKKGGILLRSAIYWHHEKQNLKNEQIIQMSSLKQMMKKRSSEIFKQFVQLALINRNLRKKSRMIQKRGIKQHFTMLIKNILTQRNSTIKNKVAIIHYAKNIKKRVINSFLMNSMRIKHKQNNNCIIKQSKITCLQNNQNTNNAGKIQKILACSRRSDKISDKISRFNMTKSRQVKMI